MSDKAVSYVYGIMIIAIMGFFTYMMVSPDPKKKPPPVAIQTQVSSIPTTVQVSPDGAIGDSGAAQILRQMSAQTPEGAALRAREKADVIDKLNSNLMIMTLACINGTLYIVHDAAEVNIGLSPLYENGADHPTACQGGTTLTPDVSQHVAPRTIRR